MAIKALTLSDTFEYVSDMDPSKVKVTIDVDPNDPKKGTVEDFLIKEGATYFGLKPLDVFLMGHIYDTANLMTGRQGVTEVQMMTRINQTNIDAVRFGLAYFKNFKDDDGNDCKVKTVKVQVNGREYDAVSDDTLKLLSIKLIQELAEKIKDASEVDKDEEKNSVSASPQSA